MADHALTQDAEQNGGWGAPPCAPTVCWLHIYREEVLVGEGVQLQEVELALEISNVTAHRRACHTPPGAHTSIVPQWDLCSTCADLADALSVLLTLLLSNGVIVTPQVLNHVRQTADCVAEQNIKLLYL